MLTNYQEKAFKWLRQCYFYLYKVPVVWDSKQKCLSTNTQVRKWIFWGIGNFFVFMLWYTCVHTLSTQFILHRKGLKLLPICILTTGFCCFTATLASARGLYALRNNLYISALNQYMQLELNIFKNYYPAKLKSKQPITKLDTFILLTQLGNLVPFLIYIVCIFWDLDGPYWILEDLASDPKYRNISTILLFLLIRTILLLPGFLETTRTLLYSSFGWLCAITYQKTIIQALAFKVNCQSDFFRFYSHLSIICNVLGPGFGTTSFVAVSLAYFLFIQTLWVCVSGFGQLDTTVYLFFAFYAVTIIVAVAITLPLVASTGDVIKHLPKKKVKRAKMVHCTLRSHNNKIFVKKSVSLRSIIFSYGSYYPFGREFSRNLFDNMVQNLMSLVLVFDMSG